MARPPIPDSALETLRQALDASSPLQRLLRDRDEIDRTLRSANHVRTVLEEAARMQFPSTGGSTPPASSAPASLSPTPPKASPPAARPIADAGDLGAMIKAVRQAQGRTQQQFADLAGVGRRFLSELENGKPTLEFGKVLMVAAAAGIDLVAIGR